MAWIRCAACGEKGVKQEAFTTHDVCTICHTSQKKYEKENRAERDAANKERIDFAERNPLIALSSALIAGFIVFSLFFGQDAGLWGSLIAAFIGAVFGYTYSKVTFIVAAIAAVLFLFG